MKLADFIDWLLIIVIALMVWSLSGCGGGSSNGKPTPVPARAFETERGAKLLVFEGEDPTPEDLAEVDRQISRIIEIANGLNRGYLWPGHGRHVIEIVSSDAECETPGSFQVPAKQYGGDLICVAGRYHPKNDRIETTLAAIRTSKIIQYESEHFGLRYNDEQEYNRTLTHQPPNGHPIFGIE